jgi:ATP-dependent Lhr-like helicase
MAASLAATADTLVRRVASDPLASFTPQVRDWFTRSFERPTAAQEQAWPAIAAGEDVLVSAPTGSG